MKACIQFLFTSLVLAPCSAFVPITVVGKALHVSTSNVQNDEIDLRTAAVSTSSLFLAKKRRRKTSDTSDKSDGTQDFLGGDDLPEFELAEDNASASKSKPSLLNPDIITSAMMGSTSKPSRSVNELISDRALEKTFVFEEEKADSSIPDFVELARQSTTIVSDPSGEPDSVGKRARQAARRAAAIEAKAKEEEGNALKNIPFISNEKGDISGVKVRRMTLKIDVLGKRSSFSDTMLTSFL
jgi:hypothetical protein